MQPRRQPRPRSDTMTREDLSSIDVSQLDALARLDADHRAIEALSKKAAWRRDREMEIYARVTADYEARLGAIAEQAAPIRQRLHQDLQKLEALCQHCEAELDRARTALQEVDFRREIGEFTTEQFQQSQQAAERTVAEREAEFASVRELRQRYRDVLPVTQRARVGAVKPAGTAPAVVAPGVAAPGVAVPVAPAPIVSAPIAPAAAVPAPIVPAATGAPPPESTAFLPPPSAEDFRVLASDEADNDSKAFATMAISAAMLIEDRGGLPGTHHRLGQSTTIGRAPENEIVVPNQEVSRRHARIVVVDSGYVLRDLGSPNGTFVNGTRVTSDQRLRDGDKITVGGKDFLFAGPA
jgi:hypothetical protein